MNYLSSIASTAVGLIFPIAALAQPAPTPTALPHPTQARTPVPTLRYESALGGYRPMNDKVSPAEDWRPLNEVVRNTGGMSTMTMGGKAER